MTVQVQGCEYERLDSASVVLVRVREHSDLVDFRSRRERSGEVGEARAVGYLRKLVERVAGFHVAATVSAMPVTRTRSPGFSIAAGLAWSRTTRRRRSLQQPGRCSLACLRRVLHGSPSGAWQRGQAVCSDSSLIRVSVRVWLIARLASPAAGPAAPRRAQRFDGDGLAEESIQWFSSSR